VINSPVIAEAKTKLNLFFVYDFWGIWRTWEKDYKMNLWENSVIFNEAVSAVIYWMEQCFSREANTCLGTWEISRILCSNNVPSHLQNFSHQRALYLNEFSLYTSEFLRYISSYLRLYLLDVSLLRVSQQNSSVYLVFSPCTIHVPSSSCSLGWIS